MSSECKTCGIWNNDVKKICNCCDQPVELIVSGARYEMVWSKNCRKCSELVCEDCAYFLCCNVDEHEVTRGMWICGKCVDVWLPK